MIRFEPLSKSHDRESFVSGAVELDAWFRARSSQDERRNVARVFVAIDDMGIVGFYSLSMFTLLLEDLPPALARKLPRYGAIPAALIGRLARHERVKGKGVGELLLADAVTRILAAARSVAAFAPLRVSRSVPIVVHAKDERAVAFYKSLGFVPFPLHPDRLFLLADTAAAAMDAAARK
jgi:GNAT superfamily N-acetyltransferase